MAQFIVLQVSKTNVANGYAYTPTSEIITRFGGAQNSAQIAWEDVIVDYLTNTRYNTTQARYKKIPTDYPQLQSDLDSGIKFEWAWSTPINPLDTPQAKLAAVKAHIQAQESVIVDAIINRLQYWGKIDDSAV